MKKIFSEKKKDPVPGRGVLVCVLACILLVAGTVTVRAVTAPWYITVDGEKTVLVKSREAAEETLQAVIDEYRDNEEEILDIEVTEKTGTEKVALKDMDSHPEILSVEEAKEKLTTGNDGKSYLTVVVTREKKDKEKIAFEEELKPEPSLPVGEEQVETKGKEGIKEVTKVVVSENGRLVKEKEVEEHVVENPVTQLVLTGTKAVDGYGGGSIVSDSGVSYNENVTYTTLTTPVKKVYVSSPFGPRWGKLHHGLDMADSTGSDIYAADDGIVYYSGCCGGYGNLIKVDHGNGMQTYYAHCSRLLVSQGDTVKAGERIALMGSTGNSTGPHLHFEVIINGVRVDPSNFLELQ